MSVVVIGDGVQLRIFSVSVKVVSGRWGVMKDASAPVWIPTFAAVSVLSGASSLISPVSRSASSTWGTASAAALVGLDLGEGLLPIPAKLQQQILRLEFIEMRELLQKLGRKTKTTAVRFGPENRRAQSLIFCNGCNASLHWWGYCQGCTHRLCRSTWLT